jgi:hypothetical protein
MPVRATTIGELPDGENGGKRPAVIVLHRAAFPLNATETTNALHTLNILVAIFITETQGDPGKIWNFRYKFGLGKITITIKVLSVSLLTTLSTA